MKNKILKSLWVGVISIFVLCLTLMYSCNNETTYSLSDAGIPAASFTMTQVEGVQNTYEVINTSTGDFNTQWDMGDGSSYIVGKDTAILKFFNKGTYNVKLTVLGQGGKAEAVKEVVIASDIDFLTGGSTKVWKLNPEAGALWVSQYAAGSGSWWKSDAQVVIDRPCMFNDTHTFTYITPTNGTFVFDDLDDFYGDGYLGDNSNTCQASSAYTPAQQPWGSGNFTYTFTPNAGVKGLGQITVEGLGAHIGIQKAINNNETPGGATATSITYDIWSKQHVTTGGGYDLLTLTYHYGGWSATDGWWTYVLRSY